MTKLNGTAYERVTRVMVVNIKEDVKEMKCDVKKLTNHYSKRLPHWATIIITLLSSLTVGLIVKGVYTG